MRPLLLMLVCGAAACGPSTTHLPGSPRDLGDGLPDSHVQPEAADLATTADLAGADLAGADLAAPPDLSPASDLASGLDPNLALPDPNGQPCTNVGYETGCPSIQVCRFYSPSEGRCESCTSCGNLHASCNASSECDILFMCYQHKCTNFCTLGTSECGAVSDCVNIGHPTRGVCKN